MFEFILLVKIFYSSFSLSYESEKELIGFRSTLVRDCYVSTIGREQTYGFVRLT